MTTPGKPAVRAGSRDDGEARLVELMVAYQAGNVTAFEELYAQLAEELHRYFAAKSFSADLGRDLLQDTFLEIHRSRRTYLPPLPVRPWVFGIARNVLARHRRMSGRRVIEERALDARDENLQAADAGGVVGVELDDVSNALARLPVTTRSTWLLHHVEGLSFRTIAARFGIGIMAAKLRSSRATKAVRAALGVTKRPRR